MEKFIKKDLAEKLVEKFGESKKQANDIVNTIFDEITRNLSNGDVTDISGFGKFVTKTRNEREGINPLTQEKITIPATTLPAFKASKALKECLKS